MSPFWSTFLSELRGRGRNGMLFLGVVFLLVSLALVASAFSTEVTHGYFLPAGLGLALLVLVLFGRAIWRAFTGKHARGSVGELSCDELNKARSKLMNRQTRRSS